MALLTGVVVTLSTEVTVLATSGTKSRSVVYTVTGSSTKVLSVTQMSLVVVTRNVCVTVSCENKRVSYYSYMD